MTDRGSFVDRYANKNIDIIYDISNIIVGITLVKLCETGNNNVPKTSKPIAKNKIMYKDIMIL